MSERNIQICGGGLAGLSLGFALANRDVPVTVWEKGRYPRHRVCGEFICGVSDEVLERLGILSVFVDAQELKSMAWWHEGKQIMIENLSVKARGISRYALDQRLADALVSAGGELRSGERCSPQEMDGEGVIWTAGRPSVKKSRWIGLKCHLEDFAMVADLEMHLGPGGYAGLSRIEDGKVNLCGLFEVDSQIKARMPDLLFAYLSRAGASELLERIRVARVDTTSCCSVAGFSMGDQAGPDGLLTAGDSRRMIPPFTGNGMSMALESADILAEELVCWQRGKSSWAEVMRRSERAMDDHFWKRMKLARALHIPLMHPALQKCTSAVAAKGLLPIDWVFRQLRAI